MKTLKLDHKLAEMVRAGTKTAEWRMYDDKDIRVNDDIELIDKVDPTRPETWVSIGIAHVDLVVEKRLGDITPADTEGQHDFGGQEAMLAAFQRYYGPNVTLETPVKMIHFTLQNQSSEKKVEEAMPHLKEAKLYADGGSRGNPGPSSSGYAVLNMDDQVIVKKGVYLGITTNNQAEYQALRLGLKEALSMGVRTVHVYMDSLLVVNQMLGIFKVRNRDLWPIHESIKQILPSFKHVTFTHVPRELNKIADSAVNEALDEAAAKQ